MSENFTQLTEAEAHTVRLRASDVREIAATSLLTPSEALWASVQASLWHHVFRDALGAVVAVWGVAARKSALDGIGCPWFLATDAIKDHRMLLLRTSRRHIEIMQHQFPVLSQLVDARHKEAFEWLMWLGFDVLQTTTPGLHGETLIQVIRRKPCATFQAPSWQ